MANQHPPVDRKRLAEGWAAAKALRPGLTKTEYARMAGVHASTVERAVAAYPVEVPAPERPPEVTPVERKEAEDRNARLRREHAQLVEELREARAREEVLTRLRESPPMTVERRERGHGAREATAVCMLSDLHVEERVTLQQSGGVNEYDLGIAEASLSHFFDEVRWLNNLYRPTHGVRDVVLVLGGDLMTGFIHEEYEETNQLAPMETSLWLRDHLVAGIDDLLRDAFERLLVVCVPGNHGRTTKKIRRTTYGRNSYEWGVYQQLARHFAGNARVQFAADQTPHKWFELYGSTIHVCHGDDVKYFGGVGGLSVPLGKRAPSWDRLRKAELHMLGHFHQLKDFGFALVNGSMIGYNAFALSIGADPEPPRQAYFLWDSREGKTAVTPIYVRD